MQTIGRAARNADGMVIMYADSVTPSMERAIMETERRRGIQHGLQRSARHRAQNHCQRACSDSGVLEISRKDDDEQARQAHEPRGDARQKIEQLTREMKEAAKILEFEHAAFLRDRIDKLRKQLEQKAKL